MTGSYNIDKNQSWAILKMNEVLHCLYRSWKTWKVIKFKNFIFQALKVMEFNCLSLKVMEN